MPYISKKNLEALLLAGQQCSNCCYNLSQVEVLPAHGRKSMKESAQAWDQAKESLRKKNK